MRSVGASRWAVAVAMLALATAMLMLTGAGASGATGVTLTLATRGAIEGNPPGYTEAEAVLGEIYAEALEGAGYRVVRKTYPGIEIAEATKALQKGKISGYFDHLNAALTATLGWPAERVLGGARKAYRAVRGGFGKKGLTTFPPTPFSPTYAVGALRRIAAARGWKTIADLRGQSRKLTISGVVHCHLAMNCVGGLEARYGLRFAGYSNAPTDTFKALETRYSDLSMLPNTDGRLITEKHRFAILEDSGRLLPACNSFLVTTPKVVREAGPEFENTIVAAQKGLTLPVIQELDARVEFGHETLRAVAAGYLRKMGLSD